MDTAWISSRKLAIEDEKPDSESEKLAIEDEKPSSEHKMEEEPSEMICPKCGSKLVLRTARKGGNKFYGCSAFPKCRYVKNV